jgi:hypothetical protein
VGTIGESCYLGSNGFRLNIPGGCNLSNRVIAVIQFLQFLARYSRKRAGWLFGEEGAEFAFTGIEVMERKGGRGGNVVDVAHPVVIKRVNVIHRAQHIGVLVRALLSESQGVEN